MNSSWKLNFSPLSASNQPVPTYCVRPPLPHEYCRKAQIQSAYVRQLQDLNNRVDRLVTHVPKQIKSELKEIQTDMTNLSNDLLKYRNRVLSAENQTKNLREEVNDLKTSLAEALSSIDQFKTEIKEMGLAIEYAAGGPVYQDAKAHFESQCA